MAASRRSRSSFSASNVLIKSASCSFSRRFRSRISSVMRCFSLSTWPSKSDMRSASSFMLASMRSVRTSSFACNFPRAASNCSSHHCSPRPGGVSTAAPRRPRAAPPGGDAGGASAGHQPFAAPCSSPRASPSPPPGLFPAGPCPLSGPVVAAHPAPFFAGSRPRGRVSVWQCQPHSRRARPRASPACPPSWRPRIRRTTPSARPASPRPASWRPWRKRQVRTSAAIFVAAARAMGIKQRRARRDAAKADDPESMGVRSIDGAPALRRRRSMCPLTSRRPGQTACDPSATKTPCATKCFGCVAPRGAAPLRARFSHARRRTRWQA